MNFRVKIHRGAREVGGSCIELEAAGRRLVLDLGRPLDAPLGVEVPLPRPSNIAGASPSGPFR